MKLTDLAKTSTVDVDGAWVDYTDGVRLKIRPQGCKAFDEYIRKAVRGVEGGPDAVVQSDEISEALTVEATAHALLVDWEGITDANDNPVPYDATSAHEAMKGNYRFFKDVTELARKIGANLSDYEARVKGN